MAQKPLSKEEAQEALDFYYRMGRNRKQTARYMNLPESTISNRLAAASRYNLSPSKEYVLIPNFCNLCSTRSAKVDFPEPESPVNHKTIEL